MNFAKYLRTPFLTEHPPVAASVYVKSLRTSYNGPPKTYSASPTVNDQLPLVCLNICDLAEVILRNKKGPYPEVTQFGSM